MRDDNPEAMMTVHRMRSSALGYMALLLCLLLLGWLWKSSSHPDRPPLFALAALVLAVLSGGMSIALLRRQ